MSTSWVDIFELDGYYYMKKKGDDIFKMAFIVDRIRISALLLLPLVFLSFVSCGKERQPSQSGKSPAEVTVFEITPKTIPAEFEYIGQTESSRQVEIRARVDGFLEKRVYEEGAVVKEGTTLFLMDKKPFEASLQQAKGELAQQEAKLENAKATLARIKPLAEKNAMSKKDLDDAIGNEQSAQAAVISAHGKVRQAELNLSYATIVSPVTGITSKARKQEGSYISSADNLLTTVSQLNPIYVNFSISENESVRMKDDVQRGLVKLPPNNTYSIEVVLSDGKPYPHRGKVNFAEPSFSPETGTFLVRAEIANPKGDLRPGQFVRVRVHGVYRPNAIIVPQRAVLQTAQGSIVFVVDKDNKAQVRPVRTGELIGDKWIISEGLRGGEMVVVDGAIKLSPGAPVKVVASSIPAVGEDVNKALKREKKNPS